MPADAIDIAAVAPAMELMLERPATLRCSGRLDGRTRRSLCSAVETLLSWGAATVTIDVSDLRLGDREGAGALVRVQQMVLDAGVSLRWIGLDAGRLHLMRFLDLSSSYDGAMAMRPFSAAG